VGLLGLVSFLALLVYGLVEGLRHRRDIWKIGLALFVIAIFFHGLIDTPYLKNDLALEFWIVYALAFI
jgi:RsiW-degrading membrane proteinase PrsW (M82 family)